MTRTLSAIAALFIITTAGCGQSHRSCGVSPALLDHRLTAIEQTRLEQSAAPPLVRGAPDLGRGVPTNTAIVRTDARREDLWALTDIGDERGFDPTPHDMESSTYVRRPPLDSLWKTIKRDVRHMPEDLWRDTKRVYANPTNLIILGTAYGGSLILQEAGPDDSVEDHFRRGHHHFGSDWREALGAAGNPVTHFGLAGLWYLIGQQTADEKTYEVGKTLFSALIINNLTTLAGQAATWDRGPNGEAGTFPSGHTGSSFVTASVLHEAYGHAVGVPLYGLAALVAFERVDDNEHYFADVVMGAVLGTVIGHSVASGRDPEFFGWKLLPYAHPGGGTGVAFVKTLP